MLRHCQLCKKIFSLSISTMKLLLQYGIKCLLALDFLNAHKVQAAFPTFSILEGGWPNE